MNFYEKLKHAAQLNRSLVCVGLDPDLKKLPPCLAGKKNPIFEFNKAIVDATRDWVCCYKPQVAYYAGQGADAELAMTIDYIHEHLPKDARILVPGCGNSAISADMYNDGYHNLVNIDFSPVVIEQMQRRYQDLSDMSWLVMDIKHMSFADGEFDFVLDKGTLDALTCGEDTEAAMFTACCEYVRVLKPGGVAFIISFGQAADRLDYFDPKQEHPWAFEGFDLLSREFAPHSHYHVFKLKKPN